MNMLYHPGHDEILYITKSLERLDGLTVLMPRMLVMCVWGQQLGIVSECFKVFVYCTVCGQSNLMLPCSFL
jgi:hypothetical protein